MSNEMTLGSIVRSEWIKFRSVRSSIWVVLVTFVLTIGLGVLVTSLISAHWSTTSVQDRLTFDPVQTSLVGTILAQFAMGVIGALFISSEYSSGSIRTTLTAVPNRIELIFGKFIVLMASMFVVAEIASFGSFLIGQSILSGVHQGVSLSNHTNFRAVAFAGIYLTLMAAVGFTLGLLFRHSAAAISIFVSLLLVVPLILAFLPQSWQNNGDKYLPGEMGRAMTSTGPVTNDFSALSALIILLVYVAVLLTVSTALFRQRDA